MIIDYGLEKISLFLYSENYNNRIMYKRDLIDQMREWSMRTPHKPLVIRRLSP